MIKDTKYLMTQVTVPYLLLYMYKEDRNGVEYHQTVPSHHMQRCQPKTIENQGDGCQ